MDFENQQYEKDYSEKDFWEKVKVYAEKIGVLGIYNALLLYYTLKNSDLPTKEKLIIIGALGYLISPLDLIPDAIPVLGFTDDIAALAFAILKIADYLTPEIKQMSKEKLKDWFNYTDKELESKLN